MKKITAYLKISALICLLCNFSAVKAQCTAAFTYSQGLNGTVTFSSTSLNTGPNTQYTWSVNGSSVAIGIGASGTTCVRSFPSNGSYTITLGIFSAVPTCSSSVTQVINVTTVSGCGISAGFTYLLGSSGTVSFTSVSSTTNATTSYTWNYQGGTPSASAGTNITSFASFTTNGIHQVTLTAANSSPLCANSVVQTITVTSAPCVLTASFTSLASGNGNFNFTDASTGTAPGLTTYTYNFGDATSTNSPSAAHTYSSNGTYTVIQYVSNNLPTACTATYVSVITVTNVCNLAAGFTYSVGLNGQVNFTSTSTGTGTNTVYSWTFAPGTPASVSGTNLTQPSVTYSSSSIYTVLLNITNLSSTCTSTVVQSLTVNIIPCTISANFSMTQASNGLVNFTNTSVNTGSTTYLWDFGDGSATSSLVAPAHTYSSNGTYTIVMVATGSPTTCFSTHTAVINVNTVCNLNAAFTATAGANGLFTFSNASTGTASGTSYVWNFGDGSANSTSISTNHTYTNNGFYTVVLVATNSLVAGCTSSFVLSVTVTNVCNIAAAFSYSQPIINGTVNFINSSTVAPGAASYTWNFGDGITSSITSSPVHTYSNNGTYTVILNASGSATCISQASLVLVISNASCALIPDFTHTVGTGGFVTYISTSSGTVSSSVFIWDFGDGYTTTGNPATHAYLNGGAHNVKLVVKNSATCADSLMESINITGTACSANANFTLMLSGTPQYWLAIPAYPWNVISAVWDWGDGSTSNTLYTSHTYSVAGNYNICLTVIVSCGDTATACTSYYVNRPSGNPNSVIQVNVMPPALIPTGINAYETTAPGYDIYPNPNSGSFDLRLNSALSGKATISVYDLMGSKFYESELDGEVALTAIDLGAVPAGIYFIKVNAGNKSSTKKLIIK